MNGQKRATRFLAVASIGVLAVSMAACAGSSSPSQDKGGALVLYSDTAQWEDAFNKAGAELKEVTGYSLETTTIPQTSSYTQTILTSLPTKKTGDIIKWWSGKMLQGLAATGQLQDLTAVWDDAVEKGNLNDELRDYFSADGKVYAMPYIQSYWVNYYSKSAFEAAGVEVPKTWAEFQSALKKLTAAGYQVCTGLGDGWTPFVPFQMLAGAASPQYYKDLTEDKAKWTDPEAVEALTVWKSWLDNKWTTPADTKLADCPSLMKTGKVAIAPGGTWQNGQYKESGLSSDDYGAFLTPSMTDGEPPVVFVEAGAIAVPKNAPHGDAALEALTGWLDPSVQSIFSPLVGDSSPNPNVPFDDPVIDSISQQISSENAVILNRYYESLPPKLVQSSIETLGGFMTNPDVDATLKKLQEQADTEWAAWKEDPAIG